MSETLTSANDSTPFDSVRSAARAGAPDRYVSALLAPRAVRDDLIALAAFSAEIEKIPLHVSEPHLGEIRIQWWRDALLSSLPQTKSGHPIADAFADTIRRHDLPHSQISDHLDAAVHALYADPPADDTQLALELDMKEGVLFALAAHIIGGPPVDPSTGVIHDAAQAYGRTRLALTLPYALARGRNPLPPSLAPVADPPDWNGAMKKVATSVRGHLAHVRAAYSAQPTAIKAALLPLALVEPYLRALSHASHDPARDLADITPLTRAWCIGKSHIRARL